MLKHCSISNVSVSRRSLRQSSLTLDIDLSVSTDLCCQCYDSQFSQLCSSQCSSLCDGLITLTGYQSRVFNSEGEEHGTIDSKIGIYEDGLEFHTVTDTIKVYATCLRPHLTYKTVMITPHTTSKHVILGLLSRFRMKHRDPKLFYLTMEVTINQTFQTITLVSSFSAPRLIIILDLIQCTFTSQY